MVASNHKYDMRNTQAILTKGRRRRFRTDFSKFSLINRFLYLWSGLPGAIRTTDQFALFSEKVNQFYISRLV